MVVCAGTNIYMIVHSESLRQVNKESVKERHDMGDIGPKKWGIRKKIIWITTGFLIFIILIGLGIFGYHRLSVIVRQSQLRAAYEESLALISEEVLIPEEVYISEWNLARIIIPKIDVDLIMLGGVDVFDLDNLEKGPVHFQMSDLPSTESGNVAIAGRWQFFADIDDLVEGDEIYLDAAGYRFIYEVVWKEVVDKYDWVAIDTTEHPSITLQTSYPIDYSEREPDYRLNIRGVLREVVKAPGN